MHFSPGLWWCLLYVTATEYQSLHTHTRTTEYSISSYSHQDHTRVFTSSPITTLVLGPFLPHTQPRLACSGILPGNATAVETPAVFARAGSGDARVLSQRQLGPTLSFLQRSSACVPSVSRCPAVRCRHGTKRFSTLRVLHLPPQ